MRFFTFFACALLWTLPLQAATDGVISGKVFWKEKGASTPHAGGTLQLTTFKDQRAVSAQRTKSDEKGVYRFSKLDRSKDLTYEVMAINKGLEVKKAPRTFGSKPFLQ